MSEFISTKERLPENDDPVVIIYYNDLIEDECLSWELYRFNGKLFYCGSNTLEAEKVKAWLPLPKYPAIGLYE